MASRAGSSSTGRGMHGRRRGRPSSAGLTRGNIQPPRVSGSSPFVSDESDEDNNNSATVLASSSAPQHTSARLRARHGVDAGTNNTQPDDDDEPPPPSSHANSGANSETTRVTRVARREGLPPLDLRPRAPPLTENQQAERITALQNQIRYAFAVQRHVLRRHLRNNNWSIIEAADAFWQEEEAARNRAYNPPADYAIPMGRNVERSRLHARTVLRRRLNHGIQNKNPPPQKNTAIFGLLQRNGWDLEDAENDYRENSGDLDDITDAYSRLRVPRPSAMEQDARLAAFVSLTSTNSIHAARRHLAQHDWDYARAVDGWRRMRGLPEDRAPKQTNNNGFVHETEPNDGLRYNNANHPPYPYSYWREALDAPDDDDNDSPSGNSSSDVASDTSLSDMEDDSDGAEKPTYQDSKHKGYLIEYDRRAAMVNCPDPSKLKVEMIQKSTYRMAIFKGQEEKPRSSKTPRRRFRWHDEERENNGEVYVEFDWSNPDHINQLNDWRSQFSRRQSAVTVRPPTTPYHPLEEEFLWYRHAELLEEEVGNGHIDPTDRDSYPLRLTYAKKQQWADALNRTFAGQTSVGGIRISDEPRPLRLTTSINMARYRMRSIVDDFGLKFVDRHRPRKGRGKRYNLGKRIKMKADQFDSGSDTDYDDEVAASSGADEGSETKSDDSYEKAKAGKRKRKDKDKAKAADSKKSRRGRGGRRRRVVDSSEGGAG